MIAFTGFMLCALLAMLAAPETVFGRMCHRQLVERPVARLDALTRKDLLFGVLLLAIMFGGGEMIVLLGPEFATAYALELSVYFDAMIFAWTLAGVARARQAVFVTRLALRRGGRSMAARRRRRQRVAQGDRGAANDDDPAPALVAA